MTGMQSDIACSNKNITKESRARVLYIYKLYTPVTMVRDVYTFTFFTIINASKQT